MSRRAHRFRRGQVFSVIASFFPPLLIAAIFIWNAVGFKGVGETAMNSAARAAAQAALRSNDEATLTSDGRWYVDPTVGETTARDYVYATLVGESQTGDYESGFADDLNGAIYDESTALPSMSYLAAGTATLSEPGVDVEILNPPSTYGSQWATRSLNGTVDDTRQGTLTTCTATDGSSGVESQIDGICYAQTTIIVRIRLRVVQFGGSTAIVTTTAAASAGTNNPN